MEETLAEIFAQSLCDLLGQVRSVVVHGEQDALNGDLRD